MATPEEGAAAAPAEPKKPKAIGKIVVPLLLVMNLGATGFLVFQSLTAPPPVVAGHTDGHAPIDAGPPPETQVGPTTTLEAFVVNLNEPNAMRYLRTTLEVELTDATGLDVLEKAKQVVRDDILRYLSGLKVSDTQGEEGKTKIQNDLLARLEKLLGKNKIRRLFIKDFVIQ